MTLLIQLNLLQWAPHELSQINATDSEGLKNLEVQFSVYILMQELFPIIILFNSFGGMYFFEM